MGVAHDELVSFRAGSSAYEAGGPQEKERTLHDDDEKNVEGDDESHVERAMIPEQLRCIYRGARGCSTRIRARSS